MSLGGGGGSAKAGNAFGMFEGRRECRGESGVGEWVGGEGNQCVSVKIRE